MMLYTKLSRDELYLERLQVIKELNQNIELAQKEKDLDKKELIFDHVLNLRQCDNELQMLIDPQVKRYNSSERFLRKVCGFPKLNFTNTNERSSVRLNKSF